MQKIGRAAAFALLALCMTIAAGCGGNSGKEPTPLGPQGTKLPPGVVEQGGLPSEAPQREQAAPSGGETAAARAVLEVGGGRFTVTGVTRHDDNATVASQSVRETAGDYLEVEIEVENISDDLLDLSQFEFRLWSPGIDTEDYPSRYPLGRPVGDDLIAAALLQQEDLSPAGFSIKIGEVLEDCFVFFDLNPKSVHPNPGFIPADATFGVYKARGEGAGEKAEISLDGLVKEG